MGAAPEGVPVQMNHECPCFYPLGASRKRCAEPPPWKTQVRMETLRALSAFAATGSPCVQDTSPRETGCVRREGKGGLWCCLSGRACGNMGSLGSPHRGDGPHRGPLYTGGPETVPHNCLEGISDWKERFRSNFPYAQRSLALTSLGVQCALSCDPSNVVERQGPCGTAPLSIPPRTPLERVFSVVAQLASKWILVEAGIYVREQGAREERTRETSEAKKGDLSPWA